MEEERTHSPPVPSLRQSAVYSQPRWLRWSVTALACVV